MNTEPDLKGISAFLIITFALTFGIVGGLILSGFRITAFPAAYGQLVLAGVMWVPALATILTIRRLGLLVVQPEDFFAGAAMTASLAGSPHWIEVSRDERSFLDFLEEVVAVLKAPPPIPGDQLGFQLVGLSLTNSSVTCP